MGISRDILRGYNKTMKNLMKLFGILVVFAVFLPTIALGQNQGDLTPLGSGGTKIMCNVNEGLSATAGAGTLNYPSCDRFGQLMPQIISPFLNTSLNDTAETGSTASVIVATAHVAKVGDVVSFGYTSSLRGGMSYVTAVTANTITISPPLRAPPNNGDFFTIGRPMSVAVDSSNGILKVMSVSASGSIQYQQEDAAHTSGDYGSFALGVRNDTIANSTNTDGDYSQLSVNAKGVPYVDIRYGAQSSGADSLMKQEDNAHASGDTGVEMLAVRQDALAASANTDGDYATPKLNAYGAQYTVLTPSPSADGAQSQLTTNGYISAASTNSTLVGGNVLHGVIACNTTAANKYVKFYNSGAPTCGSGTPVLRIVVPPNNCAPSIQTVFGMRFATGIGFCITGGASDADATAVAANDVYLTVLSK